MNGHEEKEITRCELNTYVKDHNGNYGTLIIDYLSNELSMDPLNIFKSKHKSSQKSLKKQKEYLNFLLFRNSF